MQRSERNKMVPKNDPCSVGIPGIGVSLEKEREPIGRCYLNWMFLPSGQALVFCMIQNTGS